MTSQDVVKAVIRALEELSVPYMLVGSFSSNFYGIPRSTHDADFVVCLENRSIRELSDRLGPGFVLDPQTTFESVTGTYRHIIQVNELPFTVEVFLLSDDPHDQERFRRRCRIVTPQGETWLPTPEDVIVMKLRWSHLGKRRKDVDDVRNVMSVQAGHLDWQYIHSWCDQHGTRELLEEIRRELPPSEVTA
jgi:hypothetical protein